MKVTLVYSTTVHVTVDLDDQAVERVYVEDWDTQHPDIASTAGSVEDIARAVEIADSNIEWPSWESGS